MRVPEDSISELNVKGTHVLVNCYLNLVSRIGQLRDSLLECIRVKSRAICLRVRLLTQSTMIVVLFVAPISTNTLKQSHLNCWMQRCWESTRWLLRERAQTIVSNFSLFANQQWCGRWKGNCWLYFNFSTNLDDARIEKCRSKSVHSIHSQIPRTPAFIRLH